MRRIVPLCLLSLCLAAAEGPYPPSPAMVRLTWDGGILRMGEGKDGRTGDNWPITWGADNALYTSYGDGGGFADPGRKLTLGFARIWGNPPSHRGEDILSDADTPAGWGNQGIKSSGMLMAGGVLYMFVRNYVVDGNYRHSRLAWSKNLGQNWTWAGWHFSGTFGCPDFIQFGPNYSGARDRYVYLVSQANDDAYAFSPDVVLSRVPKDRITDRQAYEFFTGMSARGQPIWDRRIENRKPIFTDPRGAQRISMSYNRGLRRYLMTASHKVGEAVHNASLGVFDAPQPWGPWTTVYYDDHWSGKDRTYHHKFPTKWMSRDGRSLWLLFSGLGGGNYAFCLRRATLEGKR
ncbi:MAG: DUF4185 domain-containing protein [Acidobacteria bacterium]|nr:DUF4185 domain-containing protein [Acidobacteriota bacterium]